MSFFRSSPVRYATFRLPAWQSVVLFASLALTTLLIAPVTLMGQAPDDAPPEESAAEKKEREQFGLT